MEEPSENDSATAKMLLIQDAVDILNRASDLLPDNPTTVNERQLRNLAEFGKAISLCDNNAAKLDLQYQNQLIPLGQSPAQENVFLEDYEEKMEILNFIASTSFVQQPGMKAERVDRTLVSRFVWACIWVTPIETMRHWREAIDDDEPLPFDEMVLNLSNSLPRLIQWWRGTNAGPRPSLARQQAPKKVALQRDNYRCVLMGSHDPEVAHIYPHASTPHAKACSRVSKALQSLWGDGPIKEFMQQMNTDALDIPQNMMTLNCLIHFWLDNFKIALEPLEEISSKNELVLRIRHLKDSSLRPKRGQQSAYEFGGLSIDADPKDYLRDILTPAGHKLELDARHAQTGHPIRDGHVFSIRTTDPVSHPLPSLRIIQVQYRMILMIRLAGAAEDQDDDEDGPDPPPDIISTEYEEEDEIMDSNERIMSWADF
ncbi:hypothetical protein LZ32DRAFT_616007 [Colletotrichum eremochloae]|nr:hypothetical protein LZ32DRAFT_616007 [Colletotrichum eremochloae]